MRRLGVCISGTSIGHARGMSLYESIERSSFMDQTSVCGLVCGVVPSTALHNTRSMLSRALPTVSQTPHPSLSETLVAGHPSLLSQLTIDPVHQLAIADESPEASLSALDTLSDRLLSGEYSSAFLFTCDLLQHSVGAEHPSSLHYYQHINGVLETALDAGVAIGLTSDHAMNSKVGYSGTARIVDLGAVLRDAGIHEYTVGTPISSDGLDHHAYGSFAWVRVPAGQQDAARAALRHHPGLYSVMGGQEAQQALHLPESLAGDMVVIGDSSTLVGEAGSYAFPYSHGGLEEQVVPMMVVAPTGYTVQPEFHSMVTQGQARNFHLWDGLLGVAPCT